MSVSYFLVKIFYTSIIFKEHTVIGDKYSSLILKIMQVFLWTLPILAIAILGGSQAFAQNDNRCDSQVCYIQITGSGFVPNDIIVGSGSSVIWKNVDAKVHAINVYSLGGGQLANSTLLKPGDVFQLVFDGSSLGRHEYADAAFANMEGKVQVEPRPQGQVNMVRIDFSNPGAGIESAFLSKGTIANIQMAPAQHRLEIAVDAHDADSLRINLDRRLFDSKSPSGSDAPFQVTADGRQVLYKEVFATPADRMVSVPVPAGAKTIAMTGSFASTKLLGYDESNAALKDATETVSSYKDKGLIMGEADSLLLQARNAFGEGKYPFAKDLAKEAANMANASGRAASAANKAMGEAQASMDATRAFGIDISDAEEIMLHAKEKYTIGSYDEALNMAVQAKMAAASRSEQLLLFGVIAGSSALAAYLYLTRRKGRQEKAIQSLPADPGVDLEEQVDLERVFAEKPHLRQDDRQVLGYVIEKGGEALLADIRNNFGLPKSTAWRLVKRLEREELVKIIKFGNQDLIKCSSQDKDSADE